MPGCLGGGGFKNLFILLTIHHLFLLQFLRLAFFLCLVSLELFFFPERKSRPTGWKRERKKGGGGGAEKKACGDGEAALCRLNGAIVRRGGGEENGSPGTEGV